MSALLAKLAWVHSSKCNNRTSDLYWFRGGMLTLEKGGVQISWQTCCNLLEGKSLNSALLIQCHLSWKFFQSRAEWNADLNWNTEVGQIRSPTASHNPTISSANQLRETIFFWKMWAGLLVATLSVMVMTAFSLFGVFGRQHSDWEIAGIKSWVFAIHCWTEIDWAGIFDHQSNECRAFRWDQANSLAVQR